MAFEMRWYTPDRIMFVEFSGQVSKEEVREAAQHLITHLQFDPRKYMIIDASNVTDYPSLIDLQRVVQQLDAKPTATWVITYGFLRGIGMFLLSVAMQMIGVRFRALSNLEESVAFLKEVDDTLPDVLPIPQEFIEKREPYAILAKSTQN